QGLPKLLPKVVVAQDARSGRGPLQGLAAGLAALPPQIDAAYVTACDAPLLVPAFARLMLERLGDFSIAVPRDPVRLHPLPAVYRRSVLAVIRQQLEVDRLRLQDLFSKVPTCEILSDDLRRVDPKLQSLRNINTPQEYRDALRL